MQKILILNKIVRDGVGDFSHFADIYTYLRNHPSTQNFQLIPVICCDKDPIQVNVRPRFDKILKKIHELNIPLYFYGDEEAFNGKLSNNKDLIQCFSEATQVINISYYGIFRTFDKLLKHAKPNVVLKHIGEHESGVTSDNWLPRSLGLSENCYGLKISSITKLKFEDAFTVIAQQNETFTNALLNATQASSPTSFKSNCFFTSAYFHHKRANDFKLFLLLLGVNEHVPKNKNLILYLSSNHINELLTNTQHSNEFIESLKNTDIKSIEWITPENKTVITDINLAANKIIKILSGFSLTDSSYQALYQCVDMVAVSGDNTLEQAITYQVLPFYRSYNYSNKRGTLSGITKIIEELRDKLSETVIKDLVLFFEYSFIAEETSNPRAAKTLAQFTDNFKSLNLQSMLDAWPIVANHIREKHNFYSNLENIFFENVEDVMSNKTLTKMQSQIVFTSQYNPALFVQKHKDELLIATVSILGMVSLYLSNNK